MERLLSLVGILVLLGIGFAVSTSRKSIPWRLVAVGVGLQAYLAIFIVRTDWVPVVLTISAAACAIVLALSVLRERVGGLQLAHLLGLLGVATFLISIAIPTQAWWLLALLIPLPFLRGILGSGVALAGCTAVTYGVWTRFIPDDFVFQGVQGIGGVVTWVIRYAHLGAERLFGPIMELRGFVFAIEVGAIITLFGGLMAVLHHVGVIPWVVGRLAALLHRALGVSGAESLAAASNVFVGQTEAPLIIRPYLPRMTRSEIMSLMTGGFATIAGSVLGIYVLLPVPGAGRNTRGR